MPFSMREENKTLGCGFADHCQQENNFRNLLRSARHVAGLAIDLAS